MQEASELADPQEDDFIAGPLENDIFEWHCTMRGVQGSDYDGGQLTVATAKHPLLWG